MVAINRLDKNLKDKEAKNPETFSPGYSKLTDKK
jgi:hypothetical protein